MYQEERCHDRFYSSLMGRVDSSDGPGCCLGCCGLRAWMATAAMSNDTTNDLTARVVRPCDLIRQAIEQKNMTQKEAAAILGISQTYLSDLITGKRSVSAFVAVRLQRHFRINAQILMFQQITAQLSEAWKE